MVIKVSAGHNPDGKIACGAVGVLKESTEARAVTNLVVAKLQSLGHTVVNCTVDDGKNQNDVLNKIVKKHNAVNGDLDISIHFNSGRNDYRGDGSNGGTEVWVYPEKSAVATAYAMKICSEIAKLGFRYRGVKTTRDLYFLRKTRNQAMLIECCFVDDVDDKNLYRAEKMANAIVNGICGTTTSAKKPVANTTTPKVNATAYYPKYTGTSGSITTALKTVGVDSSFANRSKIAIANGISGYKGTAQQNILMLKLLKAGQLKK